MFINNEILIFTSLAIFCGLIITLLFFKNRKKSAKNIYKLMLKLEVDPNQAQIEWILESLEQQPNFCTQIIQQFGLVELSLNKEILI